METKCLLVSLALRGVSTRLYYEETKCLIVVSRGDIVSPCLLRGDRMSRCLLHRDKVSPRLLHRDKVSLCLLHRDKVSPRLPMCKNFVPLENPARASELNHARLNHFGETTALPVITRQRRKVKPNIIMAPTETVYRRFQQIG